MEKINSKISRLRLHDSHLEKITKVDNNLKIEFDWAFLSDYKEMNIKDGIVIGKSILEISGYNSELFEVEFKGSVGFEKKAPIEFPFADNITQNWDVILDNEINDVEKKVKISGFYDYENIPCWINWTFKYQGAELKWDSYVLHEDWKKGAVPE